MRSALIIPCYNFEKSIPQTIDRLTQWRLGDGRDFLIYFIDDGSTDDTFKVLQDAAEDRREWMRVLRLPHNQGKGAAVRAGFKAAQGLAENIIFTDCDLHYGLDIIKDRILPGLENHDIVILDRAWSIDSGHQTFMRRLASGVFNRAMAILTGVAFRDSQAGLKGFRTSSCRYVFELATINGFTFDVELLSIALYYRLHVSLIPILFKSDYEFPHASSIRLVRNSLTMLRDLLRINLNWKRGKYKHRALQALVEQNAYSIKNFG